METTIYEIQARAQVLREKTQEGSVTPEEVGGLIADTLTLLANIGKREGGLRVSRVYSSKAEMEADTNPENAQHQPLKAGQLVVIHTGGDNPENGTVYVYLAPGWKLIGNLSHVAIGESEGLAYPGTKGKKLAEELSVLQAAINAEVTNRSNGDTAIKDIITTTNSVVEDLRKTVDNMNSGQVTIRSVIKQKGDMVNIDITGCKAGDTVYYSIKYDPSKIMLRSMFLVADKVNPTDYRVIPSAPHDGSFCSIVLSESDVNIYKYIRFYANNVVAEDEVIFYVSIASKRNTLGLLTEKIEQVQSGTDANKKNITDMVSLIDNMPMPTISSYNDDAPLFELDTKEWTIKTFTKNVLFRKSNTGFVSLQNITEQVVVIETSSGQKVVDQLFYIVFDEVDKVFRCASYNSDAVSVWGKDPKRFFLIAWGALSRTRLTCSYDYVLNGETIRRTFRISDVKNMPIEDFSWAEISRTENLFDKDDKDIVVNGFLGTNGLTKQASSQWSTTGFMPVEGGKTYKLTANSKDLSSYWYYYDAEKTPFRLASGQCWNQAGVRITVPEGVSFVRKVLVGRDNKYSQPTDLETLMFTLDSVDVSSYIPYKRVKIKGLYTGVNNTSSQPIAVDTKLPKTEGGCDVGNLQFQNFGQTDYAHIILYGQSLSQGFESPEAITTEPINGNFMLGTMPAIYGANTQPAALNPLVSVKSGLLGEAPIVSLTNAFSLLYRKYVGESLFIGTNPSQDGRSIECLSKECKRNEQIYQTRFLRCLTKTKELVDAQGKTVSCPALLYMQGEYNYTLQATQGITDDQVPNGTKDSFKRYLLILKNNMQNDVMRVYGQKERPLFFIYQVAGNYINGKTMPINMAIVEFALENDDVFLLNPTYYTSDYRGGHLSTNGYRWYGELMAKSLYEVFIKHRRTSPIRPINIELSSNKKAVYIDYYVPALPLVLEELLKEKNTDYGFRLYDNGVDIPISSINIQQNRVVLNVASTLNGIVEVTYGGHGRGGSGNLRDSDKFHSHYRYYNDSGTSSPAQNYIPKNEDGDYLYGEYYPLYNWAIAFYWNIGFHFKKYYYEKPKGYIITSNVLSNEKNVAVTYESDDTNVATVDSKGIVTLKAAGYASISAKATYNGAFFEQSYLVKSYVNIGVGKTARSGYDTSAFQHIEYVSSNEEIATVVQDGEITGVAVGEANIQMIVSNNNGKKNVVSFPVKVE